MITKKLHHFGAQSGKVSSFKKKLIAFFIFICMLINGFVPSTAEISKYSLFMVFAAATQNAVVKVFSKCNDSLVVISNKLCKEAYNFIFSIPLQTAESAKKQNHSKKDNTSDNHTVVIKHSTLNESRRIIVQMNDNLYSVFVFVGKLFKLYMRYKIPDETASTGLIVVFLVFIIAIRRRKDIEEGLYIISRENKGKIRISA